MRRSFKSLNIVLLAIVSIVVAGCQTNPTFPVNEMSPQAQRVAQALELWPEIDVGSPGLKRPFFATVHIAGKRTTASGILDYHNPRDFRVTAITEMGVVLFDARMNWAGITVLRQMPGLPQSSITTLVGDLSRAMQLPESLNGLVVKGDQLKLSAPLDNAGMTWFFDRARGQLRQTDVKYGVIDTLHINYLRYNSRGWPEEVSLVRKARLYDITFTFTDNNLVQHSRHENAQ